MKKKKLHEPCPFCGSRIFELIEHDEGETEYVTCNMCSASGPPMIVMNNKAGVWALWDSRKKK